MCSPQDHFNVVFEAKTAKQIDIDIYDEVSSCYWAIQLNLMACITETVQPFYHDESIRELGVSETQNIVEIAYLTNAITSILWKTP